MRKTQEQLRIKSTLLWHFCAGAVLIGPALAVLAGAAITGPALQMKVMRDRAGKKPEDRGEFPARRHRVDN